MTFFAGHFRVTLFAGALTAAGFLLAQDHQHQHDQRAPQPGEDAATQAMSTRTLDMGPHMKMTRLWKPMPGDSERAQNVVDSARRALERYKDYRHAEADGYRVFFRRVPQKMYHFTNWRYAMESALRFDPERPTSLLYEKQGNGYKLIGVMYTAPANMPEDELHARIPLSVARWHAHVNLCLPPRERRREALGKNARFGLQGSITTREECEQEGGHFMPQIFGWMVHMYPFEETEAKIWSLEPQAPGHHH
ncbi:MAG TPA: hypothetical protein VNK82_12325 [Terriglobales bacterium]|nr:hypothetical protein [Terriglobales bacterium]